MENFIDLADRMADEAAKTTAHYFRSDHGLESKDDQSPVTLADRAVERALYDMVRRERPEDSFQGEEFGSHEGSGPYRWVVDPIDGTKAFATGRATFSTLIALLENGIPVMGLIDQPIVKDRFIATKGLGSWHNGQKARTSACEHLASARAHATSPDMFTGAYGRGYLNIKHDVSFIIYGGDSYAYGLLATGHLDLVIEAKLKVHDIMAAIPVIEEAGGIITDWKGVPITPDFDGSVLAAATPELHKHALGRLSPDL